MALQSCGSPTLAVSGLPFGSLETKRSFGCGPHREAQRILYGGRWWLPPNSAVVSLMSPKSPVAYPSTKGVVT
jgi:hypothetical protein